MQSTSLSVAGMTTCLGAGGYKLQVSPLRQTKRPFGFGRDDKFLGDRKREILARGANGRSFTISRVAVRA
jgi:hypothetical protein